MTRKYDFENFVRNFTAQMEQFAKVASETGKGQVFRCHYSLEFLNGNGNPKFCGDFDCPVINNAD